MELNVPPPFMMEDVTAWVGLRGIQWRAAQDWVDETLNWRSSEERGLGDVSYLAAPMAFVTFMEIGSMKSLDSGYRDWPAMKEKELHVTLPVFEKRWGGFPNFLNPRFYPVALILDSSPAMIAGREVYGFPKIHGAVEVGDTRLSASTEVFGRHGDQTTHLSKTVVEMKATGDCGHDGCESVPSVLGQMARECVRGMDFPGRDSCGSWLECWGSNALDDSLEIFASVFAGLTSPQDFVFLKQFRDHEVAHRASYRAVTEAPVEFSNIRDLRRLTGDWTLDVPEFHSSRMLRGIGLESGKIVAPIRVSFDFKLPLGRTIWSSG